MDILGSAQTLEAHKAVMNNFNFVRPVALDPVERYLWSLSVARKPKIEFVQGKQLNIERLLLVSNRSRSA